MSDRLFGKMQKKSQLGGAWDQLQFSQACSWDDAHGAFSLLYESYRDRKLIGEHPSGLRYTHFNLLDTSATFIAKRGKEVVATLSVVLDSKNLGLPMDALYADCLDELRRERQRPAEGTGLAVHPSCRPIGMYIIMNLVKMAITYAQKVGGTCAVVACHPKHARFYEDVFLFKRVGIPRHYAAVNDAPAVALTLGFENLEQHYREASSAEGPGIYRYFFTDEIFRLPKTAIRAGAFDRETLRQMCMLQPEVVQQMELVAPGLVAEMTGLDVGSVAPWHRSSAGFRLWSGNPVFVPV